MITTFDLARQDIDLLDDLAWSCIIVDEVHSVKNSTSKITEALSRFHCTRRFGLTGTGECLFISLPSLFLFLRPWNPYSDSKLLRRVMDDSQLY